MSELTRATSIREAVHACELGALSGEKLAWWADLTEARGTNAVSRLKSYLDLRAPDRFLHLAFTGHRGCGKSTELLRLTRHWERDFLVVYFPVTELLDPNDVAFSDLFLAISMQVAQACHDAGMPLDPRLLANVESFAAAVIKESTKATDAEIAAGAQVEAGGAIPFFAKLKAWITSQYKASTQHKQTIRRVFERDITRLITNTNLLLDDARDKLRRARPVGAGEPPPDLLIILDNLDRVPPDVGERLVFRHGDFLKQIRANVIFTVPVSVLHSPRDLGRVFPRHDFLPMVQVLCYDRLKTDLDWDERGVDAFVDAVARRIDVQAVFDDEELVRELARHSGGCPRHLMQLIGSSGINAHGRQATTIGAADVDRALKGMQYDFEHMIPQEHYPVLAEVARTKAAPNNEAGRAALFNLSILEYHGERRWNYVHPLVRRIDRFSEALRERRPSAEGQPA